MRRVWAVLVGGAVGLVAPWMAMYISRAVLPRSAYEALGEALAFIAHPVALLLAMITRQRLEAEMSIVLHLGAIFAMSAAAGAIAGWRLSGRAVARR